MSSDASSRTVAYTAAHKAMHAPRLDWLSQYREDAFDPAQAIVDAHHHLWEVPGNNYLRDELQDDLRSGHNMRATVFMECLSHYFREGPEALRPVGETGFVVGQTPVQKDGSARLCAAIVGWADLLLGDAVRPVLEAHAEAGQSRFRGVRSRPTWHDDPAVHPSRDGRAGLLREPAAHTAVRALGRMGLSLDIWVYQTQLDDVEHLAAACPDTVLVLNHCGGPLFAGQQADVFGEWRARLQRVAAFPNVRLKLGGLAMPRMGFGFELADRPVSSERMAQAWKPWIDACIDAFGVDRCLFESNFPVDKVGCSYGVLWNAFQRIAQGYSTADRDALFAGTAARTYRIEDVLTQP